MITDIFIRTYHKDINWLSYCLKSIHKFAYDFRDVIICIPESQAHLLAHLTNEKIVTCKEYADDYLGQQISKLNAHTYTDADRILFSDSDVVYVEPFSPEDFTVEGKPRIMKTHYSKVGDAICWKSITEKCLGVTVEYEYMRRNELMYYSETLRQLHLFYNNELNGYIENQPARQFSEYNILGAYADIYHQDKYFWMDTDLFEIPKPKVRQFWSWGGIEPHLSEINKILE